MAISVVYRSHGGENMKNRPDYYSKRLALLSLLRAADIAGLEIHFLNDGPIPEDRMSLMRGRGEITTLPGVGMRQSYLAGLRLPERLGKSDSDFVWFSEDDYLYAPESLVAFVEATKTGAADYYALFASTERFPICPGGVPAWQPHGWTTTSTQVGDQRWSRVLSTASTFGARCGALREDLPIFRQAMLPHRRMYRDHETCVVFQGYEPHSWLRLGRDLLGGAAGTPKQRVREVVMAPFKAALNVRSHRRPSRRRTMLAAEPCLATHLEIEWMAPGRDWEQVARETAEWAAANRPHLTPVAGQASR